MSGIRYKAFISYRHVDADRRWAKWLIQNLESYRVPKPLVRKGYPPRIGPLFRDDEEIPASSDLSSQIETALDASDYLIVVCSPDTPKSLWVRREIQRFQETGKGDRILALLIDGEPSESFPPELSRRAVSQDDGASTTHELVEPIASDVRPRSDEKPSATKNRALLRIAAGLLGCRFDDLAQRELQRKRNRQRVIGTAAAILITAIAATSIYWWDFTRLKTDYFANVSEQWGVPMGVGPVARESVDRREFSYEIRRTRGNVISMRRVSGMGLLVPIGATHTESEPLFKEVTRWDFSYDSAGEVDSVELFNKHGKLISKQIWDVDREGATALVLFQDAYGRAQPLAGTIASFSARYDSPDSRTAISRNRLQFDDEGRIAARRFESVWGAEMHDGRGVYGRTYAYDARGILSSIQNVDRSGDPFEDSDGIAALRRTHDESGTISSVSWLDARGTIATNDLGYASILLAPDSDGNVVRAEYIDTNLQSVLTKQGIASRERKFDSHGNPVEVHFYDREGLPTLYKNSHAKIELDYDSTGELASFRYYDRNGNLAPNADGYAVIAWRYDDQRYIVERAYYDTQGKPIAPDRIVARTEWRYDKNGKQIEETFYAFNGRIVQDERNVARTRWVYDAKGSPIEEAKFDAEDNPIEIRDIDVARIVWEYDDKGYILSQSHFDRHGDPTPWGGPLWNGVARVEFEADDQGNMLNVECFDVRGEPVLSRGQYARVRREYDEYSNRLSEEYFDVRGAPILVNGGFAKKRYRYDDAGNMIDESYFGTSGQPAMTGMGYASKQFKYDRQSNLLEEVYFDENNAPTKQVYGFAKVANTYDSRGNEISKLYFDENGSPLEIHGMSVGEDLEILRSVVPRNESPAGTAGVSRIEKSYDSRNNLTEMEFFSNAGELVNHEDGWARIIRTFDDRDNLTSQAHYSDTGALVSRFGYARAEWDYDARGNKTREAYFGPDGLPMMYRDDWARMEWTYDEHGNELSESYFDADGERMSIDTGFKGTVHTYDGQGRRTSTIYTDPGIEGFGVADLYRIEWTYDREFVATERHLTEDGGSYLNDEGYVFAEWIHDDDANLREAKYSREGHEISVVGTGIDGEVIWYSFAPLQIPYEYWMRKLHGIENVPNIRILYDENERIREITFSDTNNEPMENSYGVARITATPEPDLPWLAIKFYSADDTYLGEESWFDDEDEWHTEPLNRPKKEGTSFF